MAIVPVSRACPSQLPPLRILCRLLLLLVLAVAGLPAESNPFKHPGLYVDSADLTFIRGKIAAKAEPWNAAFLSLKARVDKGYTPRPVATVYEGNGSDGVVYPPVGAEDLTKDGQMAYDFALAWALTGNTTYASVAMRIINAWSSTLKAVTGGNAELRIGWAAPHFCNAAELLKHYVPPGGAAAGWAAADVTRFKGMLTNIFYAKIQRRIPEVTGNNWITVIYDAIACIGVFCDDHTKFNAIMTNYPKLVPNYVYATGQCQESGRDQSHTQMGLAGLAAVCEVAWKQGVDLWGASGNRLAVGYEYTAKYNLGYDVPYSAGGVGNRWPVIGSDGRGNFLTIYELPYRHYVTRKGLAMPYTKKALVEHRRPEDFVGVGCIVLSRGTLTFFRGDSSSTTPPTITTQPVSRTVNAGQTATFTVAAAGSPAPTYQWQKNSADISGATAASYTTVATAAGDHGAAFRCVVRNSAGTATSNAATLTVNVAPAITTQPVSQTKTIGQTATFTVAASGRPTPIFQWQKNGANISGATAAGYTTPAISAADQGATYRCVVSNSVGSATSAAATLTVGGIGWQGSYYDSRDFAGTARTRTDMAIDFDWLAGAPMAGMGVDGFSVRWRGMVTPAYSQTYTFTATCDDGVRLWVGGRRIIDRWQDQGATATAGLVNLTAGVPVLVVMEYYENAGSASAQLEWQSASRAKQVIPYTAVVPAMGEDLPGGWTSQDVGTVAAAGSAAESAGTWTVRASGTDIWNNADGCRLVWQRVDGDVRITAKVASLTATHAWTKAGVMVRESLAAGSRHAFTCVTAANGISFVRRLATDGTSSSTAGPKRAAPAWVRLERSGNVLIGSSSSDGVTWTEVRRETVTMGTSVQVGLAVSSHVDGTLATATFTNVQITAAGAVVN